MAKTEKHNTRAEFNRIMGDLKNGALKPVYMLMGEEAYYVDLLADYLQEKLLSEAEKSFNLQVFYGKDAEARTVLDAVRGFPMMGKKMVVVLREAQMLKLKDVEAEALTEYLKKPLPSTILVWCHKGGSIDKRKAYYKQAAKVGEVFESSKVPDYHLAAWITDYMQLQKRSMDNSVPQILAESLGSDLSKIVNELDKLAIVMPEGSKITAADVERNIGISKDYNTFELNKAIVTGNVLKANRIIMHFERNPGDNPIVLTIGNLFTEFMRIFTLHLLKLQRGHYVPEGEAASALGIVPFFVKEYEAAARRFSLEKTMQVIALLREFDMRSKGWNNTSTSHGDLLRELTYKIMH
ncbi:MAG: DNA polymerase III subunit delta [Prevotellaceae bacterium]|jgi:DNA polymerase-3 subunit delta|nr:DNA polymerase III subunit delta [Prevotellaceae bacterium]